ncbi:hypothetical protein BDW42DRAFT_178476 [Aspergillus taichungensis]|uniref:Uncharacterized protein n=1 Tax=Aspergillus taichungensis TaxID=482145 RepID=A0A2J5HHU4_9EURO|nr:hypothetical protein BDW42DRAFT_178476 [Aspergillus taichungensis]
MPCSAFRSLSMEIPRAPGANLPTISGCSISPITRATTPTDEIRLGLRSSLAVKQ